jgi:DNA repair exonuclease SbcCD ATPase subunit
MMGELGFNEQGRCYECGQLSGSEEDHAALRQEVDVAYDKGRQSLQDELVEKRKLLAEQLENMQRESARVVELLKENHALRQERVELMRELMGYDALKGHHNKHHASEDALRQERDDLRSKVGNLEAAVDALGWDNVQVRNERDALQAVVDAAVEILHSEDYSIDHAWHCKSTHGRGDPCDCGLYSKEIAFNAAREALSPSGEKE